VSLRIGNLGGTTIDIDFSFLFLCAIFVLRDWGGRDPSLALLWIPVILVSLLVHELAHAAMIAIFGMGSSHIILGGMGGVTINQRHAKAWQDVLISLAGPLASFGIAALVYVSGQVNPFLSRLYGANILWGFFNLLPIHPLDGGQALRNLLSLFIGVPRAFAASTWIGIAIGSALAIYAIMTRELYLGILMGYFVFMNYAAWQGRDGA
jgi:Zn-dependent protease